MNEITFLQYVEQNKGCGDKSWAEVAQQFGIINAEAARNRWRRIREASKIEFTDCPFKGNSKLEGNQFESNTNYEKGETTVKFTSSSEVLSEKEIFEECKLDSGVWKISMLWQKKQANGKVLYSACFKPIVSDLDKKDAISSLEEFLSNYKSDYVPIKDNSLLLNKKFNKPVSVLISLADPHIDKVEISGTTIDDKCNNYLAVLNELLYKTYISHNVEEIVYVLGNDFFTSDTYWNTTTALTPQGVTDEFDTAYEKGFKLAIDSINKLKQYCKTLKIVYVPGNHDRTKSFYLVHALSIYFAKETNIIFDRTADNTKAHKYGNTGIFFHHGDTPVASLPLYMASKYRKMWGDVKYSEICLADKHHKKEWKYGINNVEVDGTRMFICPALTGADKWHTDKRFDNSIQAGICRIYCKEAGKIGEFETRLN